MRFLKYFWIFFAERKKFWLTPIIFVMLVLLGLLALAKDDKAFYRFLLSEKYNIQKIYLQKSNNFIKNIVNTSFNVRGEPIVCSPTDAYKCFMGTELDILVVGNFFLIKEEQDKNFKESYEKLYEMD